MHTPQLSSFVPQTRYRTSSPAPASEGLVRAESFSSIGATDIERDDDALSAVDASSRHGLGLSDIHLEPIVKTIETQSNPTTILGDRQVSLLGDFSIIRTEGHVSVEMTDPILYEEHSLPRRDVSNQHQDSEIVGLPIGGTQYRAHVVSTVLDPRSQFSGNTIDEVDVDPYGNVAIDTSRPILNVFSDEQGSVVVTERQRAEVSVGDRASRLAHPNLLGGVMADRLRRVNGPEEDIGQGTFIGFLDSCLQYGVHHLGSITRLGSFDEATYPGLRDLFEGGQVKLAGLFYFDGPEAASYLNDDRFEMYDEPVVEMVLGRHRDGHWVRWAIVDHDDIRVTEIAPEYMTLYNRVLLREESIDGLPNREPDRQYLEAVLPENFVILNDGPVVPTVEMLGSELNHPLTSGNYFSVDFFVRKEIYKGAIKTDDGWSYKEASVFLNVLDIEGRPLTLVKDVSPPDYQDVYDGGLRIESEGRDLELFGDFNESGFVASGPPPEPDACFLALPSGNKSGMCQYTLVSAQTWLEQHVRKPFTEHIESLSVLKEPKTGRIVMEEKPVYTVARADNELVLQWITTPQEVEVERDAAEVWPVLRSLPRDSTQTYHTYLKSDDLVGELQMFQDMFSGGAIGVVTLGASPGNEIVSVSGYRQRSSGEKEWGFAYRAQDGFRVSFLSDTLDGHARRDIYATNFELMETVFSQESFGGQAIPSYVSHYVPGYEAVHAHRSHVSSEHARLAVMASERRDEPCLILSDTVRQETFLMKNHQTGDRKVLQLYLDVLDKSGKPFSVLIEE